MKFLHTADWQIVMKAESVGAAAERAREARLCAALKVIEIARENDAIIFAGDMFEDNAIDRALVRQVGEILRSFEKPVFIILGNHDPLTPGFRLGTPGLGGERKLTNPQRRCLHRMGRLRFISMSAQRKVFPIQHDGLD